ncbi:putative winged helix-turn-helix DNA-binding domain, leucine-rich repeat domain, L [Lupinus albus]|uniref:Putative winged helix-turn-helix DNA-binding domain, leucine-rich repeat domain, L n=1 Tax=Lupinus albus TaxID=3870 RepID=A0A6A4P7B0_LUPAL|nr:putative winged helix-turn-helix DNA-binding domain, leucine-rich repeat domain, L [Lupinus albus]
MAGAIVGGAFLSGFINVVFDRLLSPEALNFIQGKKLHQNLLQRLNTALSASEALVTDAEMKQFHDANVKDWLDSLKDAVYVADDLLDLIFTEAATQNMNEVTKTNFLLSFLKDRKIVTDLEDIVTRIENIEKRAYILHLNEIPKDNFSWRIATTSLIKPYMGIHGREDAKKGLINLLKLETTQANTFVNVIPIVGMGGVGKTTLAQWVYNNDELMKEFDFKVWVCVSEEFDVVKITQTVIEAVTRGPCDSKDLSLLQEDLKDKLSGKKFFIVLDDVWSDDRHRWNNFLTPFQYGVKGSKILDNACYDESSGNSTLEEIGRKIVKKCKGLPLAAETLGGLLRTRHDAKNWNAILESEVWEFSVKDSKIVPALLISYYHLPPYLKRCFVYCSLFPKDYRFHKDELILLWMAEDLLEQPKRGKTLEEVGCEYFDALVSRLFFKQFSTGENLFVMHDLMHDLAMFVGGYFYFQFEDLGNVVEMSTMTRHSSYKSLTHPISKEFDAISRIKSLRTLLQIDSSTPFKDENLLNVILSNNKCLRVLSIVSDYKFNVLTDSICELIHLRYLKLSINIKTLPDSLGDLYNLQTLNLRLCVSLTMLPNSMQKLVNLRHLDIEGTRIKEMPPGMSKLKKLQILSCFVVGKHEENGIMELGELSNLHGSLCITKLENVANSSDALKARIMDKTHIDELELEWSLGDDMVTFTESERDILDNLKPHKGLQVLSIENYKGTIFSDWVGHPSYRNMAHLDLFGCRNCCMLPSLGQLPSLKSLRIVSFDGLVIIDDEFYKNYNDHSSLEASFPSLEELIFDDLPCWEEWQCSDPNAFPKLKNLMIDRCPTLKGNLPSHLPALETLHIYNCAQLVSSLPKAHAIQELIIRRSDNVLLQEIPLSLQSIRITGCQVVKYLESLSVSQSQVVALRTLAIGDCHNLVSFPIEGLAVPSMTKLVLRKCYELKSLSCHMNTHLPNLKNLSIHDCPEIELFPDGGLPPNLKTLYIRKSDKLLSNLSSIGVHEGLIILRIRGPSESVKSFPKGLLLPQLPALTTLELYDFPNITTLDCEELIHLTSLQVLTISECPELRNMTGERLPASLIKLNIEGSLWFDQPCKMKDPTIWSKISHIPDIHINCRRLT